IKLTNVSVVRLKRSGKRFEVACYKNKVREWRNGIESDLSEVVQTDQIFTNVSKGQLSPESDLMIGFPKFYNNNLQTLEVDDWDIRSKKDHSSKHSRSNTNNKTLTNPSTSTSTSQKKQSRNNHHQTDQINHNEIIHKILIEILRNGELQVSERERQEQLNEKRKEIVNLVHEKTLDPSTNRPHTTSMIEKSIDQVHFSINLIKPSKIQALDLIKILIERNDIISICRNQMRIRLTIIFDSMIRSTKNDRNVKEDDEDDVGEDCKEKQQRRAEVSKRNKVDDREKDEDEDEDEILSFMNEVESDEFDPTKNHRRIIGLIDPSQLKSINSFIQNNNSNDEDGRGNLRIKLETLSLSAQQVIQDDHHQ
ncbi:SBDS protein C-terminal domain-domain-containing protein, partial [Phakopsora pachyrhizi]